MKVKVFSGSSSTNAENESIEQEDNDEEDIEEQGATTVQEQNIDEAIEMMLKRAADNGASRNLMRSLRDQVESYKDIFRMELGNDPPAKVPPMEGGFTQGARENICTTSATFPE